MDKRKSPFTVVSNKPDLRVVTPMPLSVAAHEIAYRYGARAAMVLIFVDHDDGTSSTKVGTHNATSALEREMLCDAMAVISITKDTVCSYAPAPNEENDGDDGDDEFDPNNAA